MPIALDVEVCQPFILMGARRGDESLAARFLVYRFKHTAVHQLVEVHLTDDQTVRPNRAQFKVFLQPVRELSVSSARL